MTKNIDVVRAYLDIPISERSSYVAEDFENVDRDGNVVMDKAAWEGMTHLLLNSFDDFDYVVSNTREEGDAVIVTARFEGKFTKDLDLSAMGMGVFPASGRKIVFPEGIVRLSVKGDKIISMEQAPGSSGVEDFYAALRT